MPALLRVAVALALACAGCGDDPESPPQAPVWQKLAENPVLTSGPAAGWDGLGVGAACVLARRDGSYQMWFTGEDSSGSQIGYATSDDGVAWSKSVANPVLARSVANDWDAMGVAEPCVLFDGIRYRMYFTGTGANGKRIGLATSDDGIHWTRSGVEPVLVPGAASTWDDVAVYTPWVVAEGSTDVMWYGARGSNGYRATGRATSTDGVTWSRLLFPVLDPMALEALTFGPCVIKRGTNYRAWYVALHEVASGGAFPGVIDFAQSRDGIEWTLNRLALSHGSGSDWDAGALRSVCVLDESAGLRMWYEGVSAGGTRAIGVARLVEP